MTSIGESADAGPGPQADAQIKTVLNRISQNNRRIFKVIVIGDSNVGKTALTYRFCGGKFPDNSEATIGVDFREKHLNIDNEPITLLLWDTAGQERFRKSMVSHYYRNVHAVLFVYDVTNMQSFENLTQWIDEYNRHTDNTCLNIHIPRVIVGNKCDLTNDYQVNTNQAQAFADMHQMPLFETSAKDDSKQNHVDAIFMTLAHRLKNSKTLNIPNGPSGNSRPNMNLNLNASKNESSGPNSKAYKRSCLC
jgi:Ras-related protein Rab-33B